MQIQSLAQSHNTAQFQKQSNITLFNMPLPAQEALHFSGRGTKTIGFIPTLLLLATLLSGCFGSTTTRPAAASTPTIAASATAASSASSFEYVELTILSKSAEVDSQTGLPSSQAGCPVRGGAVVDVTTDLRGSYEKAINEALACGKREGTITDQGASILPEHGAVFDEVIAQQLKPGDRLWVSGRFAINPRVINNGSDGTPEVLIYRDELGLN
jgi:hypothetical protein